MNTSIALHSVDVRHANTTAERQTYPISLTRKGGGGEKLKPFSCQQPTEYYMYIYIPISSGCAPSIDPHPSGTSWRPRVFHTVAAGPLASVPPKGPKRWSIFVAVVVTANSRFVVGRQALVHVLSIQHGVGDPSMGLMSNISNACWHCNVHYYRFRFGRSVALKQDDGSDQC